MLHRLGQLQQQRRGEEARRHGAHADGVLREVARHRQGHADEAALRGAVGLLAHLAVEGRDGGSEEHHALLAVVECVELRAARCEEARHVVAADQVDVDHAHEVFERRGVAVLADDALGAADAGDVHQDARGAVCGLRLVERGVHAVGVGDVADAGDAADVCRHLFSERGVAVEHGDLGAQAREFARGGLAEARGAAGDECGLSFDLHGLSPEWVSGA
ncbi:hypothetical protein D3C72_1615130 [compost metagenome]